MAMSQLFGGSTSNNIIHLLRTSRMSVPVSVPRTSEGLSRKWLVAVRE